MLPPNPIIRLLHQAGQLPVAYIADQLHCTFEEAAYLVQFSLDEGLVEAAPAVWQAADGSVHDMFQLSDEARVQYDPSL